MKNIVLLAVATMALSSPSIAKTHRHHHFYRETVTHRVNRENPASAHPQITCEMVRAYVAQVGLVQAKALAQSAGMTVPEERRAKRCLEKKV